MGRLANRVMNGVFAAASAPDHLLFRARLQDHARVQERKLLAYLQKNQPSAFGREHGFARITSIDSFRKAVPVADYESFRPYVERLAAGERQVLTAEDVLLLEPTGGTRSGSKWIPYTRSLKREFQAAVHAWILDLYRTFPGLWRCKSYWSVTPVTGERSVTPSGIPVGFEDDSDYLGAVSMALRRVFPVPPGVKNLRSLENFRYLTALYLLAARDLGLISVWNPTFLLLLLEYLEREQERLQRDIFDGAVRLPQPGEDLPPAVHVSPCPDRARSIEAAFRGPAIGRYSRIWSDLKVVSCWADGASQGYADRLAGLLPGVRLQPKGLLSTECVVSFPLEASGGAVAAYGSHFFEFLEDDDRTSRLLHELEPGGTYTVVVTTGGGFYRYDTQDLIRVTGLWQGLPVIRFVGRNRVSDLVGEKLEERHMEDAVQAVLVAHDLAPEFLLFAPETTPEGGFYALFIETRSALAPAERQAILREIDSRLKENVQYRYARELGQLKEPEGVVLPPGRGQTAYLRRCLASGQRLGDIKQNLVDHRTGWKDWFAA